MAWLGTWKHRIKITVDTTKVDADLTQFPVRVRLSASSGSGADDNTPVFDELTSDANRFKIAFTQSDGTTQLYGDIEKWDDANEIAEIWVSGAGWVLDDVVDTEFYIYYDSSQADNTTYISDSGDTAAQSVWDSNYKGVWHLNGNILDSTSNNNDFNITGGTPDDDTTGQIAGCKSFANASAEFYSRDDLDFDLAGDQTMSCWLYPDTLGNRPIGVSDAAVTNYIGCDITANKIQFYLSGITTPAQPVISSNTLSLSTWQFLSLIYDLTNTDQTIWLGTTKTTANVTAGSHTAGTGAFSIAQIGEITGGSFDGDIDEARFSAIARPDAWVKAEYNTGIDALVKDYGVEENAPAGGSVSFKNLLGVGV